MVILIVVIILIVAISSEGTVRNGAGDTIKMELQDILKGEYINPHVSIWWYKLDSVEEVSNPDMWLKANPNLGKTVSYETYQLDVERAEKAPAARNDILAKRFGLPMEGYTYYFTYEETLPHRKRDFWQLPCSLGGDLSQGDDFCAFTFLFANFYVHLHCHMFKSVNVALTYILQIMVAHNQIYLSVQPVKDFSPFS